MKVCTHPCSVDGIQCPVTCPLENGQCSVCSYSKEQPKRHPHADLIIAWANNPQLEVQFRGGGHQSNCWFPMCRSNPDWSHSEVRIKPEPKPDIVKRMHLCLTASTKRVMSKRNLSSNVCFTFDGETGELKSVEIIK